MKSKSDPNEKLQTQSIHSGRHVDPATGAVTMPLYTSTTFERDPDGAFSRHFFYSRIDNPNRNSLEQCLADLEGRRGGRLPSQLWVWLRRWPSFRLLSPGDHVVLHRDLYFGVRDAHHHHLRPVGAFKHSFVDMRNIEEVSRRSAKPETRLFWLENSNQPPY